MTIDELMEGKKPGEIKINGFYSKMFGRTNYYFVPYFKAKDQWHGLIDDGTVFSANALDEGWQLYREPKKKVKRWLWAYEDPKHKIWMSGERFYSDDESVCLAKGVVKLPWSETEFDE